jgi:hypothetical protein
VSIEAAQEAIDAWVHGYNYSRPHQSLAMATPGTVFRPAPIDVVPPMPVDTEPLATDIVEVIVPPRPKQHLAPPAEHSLGGIIHAVEWETALTPRARLLLPGDQQFKFTAALARRQVTVWASDRSIHIVLDGAVIRTRPSRLSEHDLRDLLSRGARVAGPEPARGAVTVDMLRNPSAGCWTTSGHLQPTGIGLLRRSYIWSPTCGSSVAMRASRSKTPEPRCAEPTRRASCARLRERGWS